MKSVRQKWASHKTYRKIQKAWLDYTSIADKSGDVQTVAQRLDIFLDTFDEAYREMIPQAEVEQSEVSTERIYGDCSEILSTLFNAIEKENSLKKADRAKCMQAPMNKALQLINLILKEEKYRRQVAESPDFISRLLALLEKHGSPETKILLLRMIATIAKLEGYKKILRLLISDNPELTQEVVNTVNHLLEFSNDHPDIADLALVAPGQKPTETSSITQTELPRSNSILSFSPKALISRSSVQLSRPQSQNASLPPRPKSVIMDRHMSRGPSPFDLPRRSNSRSSSSLKNVTGIDRVSQAISEVRGMFVQELGKIFPQLKDQDGLGILGMGSDETGILNSEKHYIPNEEQIQFTVAYYSQLMASSPGDLDNNDLSIQDLPENHPATLSQKSVCKQSEDTGDLLQVEPTTATRRGMLKKTASTPDFRVAEKPTFLARRNSEDKQHSEASWATRGAAVELAQEEDMMRKSQPDNVLKEFMRTQGALKSLMTILIESPSSQQSVSVSKKSNKGLIHTGIRLATKIDIMETVCKLLFQNSANQCEFKAMDGYTTLLRVIDEIVVPTGSIRRTADAESLAQACDDSSSVFSSDGHPSARTPEAISQHIGPSHPPTTSNSKRTLLLGSLMAVFFDLALDGSARDMVQNTDAFHFLVCLLLESKQLDVRQQALYAIQDLIALNSLNAVAAWRCGEVDAIIALLRQALAHRSCSSTLHEAQWELGAALGFNASSSTAQSVVFPKILYFDHFIVSEDTGAVAEMVENGSPVYQYVIALTRLLEYISVLLIQDNAFILYELSRLIMEIEFPDDSSIVINILLRSIGRIVSDMVARGVLVEEKFASIYLQVVRRIVDHQSNRSEQHQVDLSEQELELRDSVHTEQRLLTLHVLGLVLKGMEGSVDVFELLQGFDVLTSTILLEKRSCHHSSQLRAPEKSCSYAEALADPHLCQDCFRSDIVISDLALWIFRDLILQEPDNISVTPWIIHLLKSTLAGIEELRQQNETSKLGSRYNSGLLPVMSESQQDQAHALLAYLYTKICSTVSLIFRRSGDSKPAFGEAGGMQILLSILGSAQHQDIATAVLVAIGDFFAGYEGTNALLGDHFGYDGFLEIVLASCRPLDKVSCEIVLEVATVGNVMSVHSRPHVESDKSIYCTEVWPFISGLCDPQLRFHGALPFATPRKVGECNSFRLPESSPPPAFGNERRPSSMMYPTNGRGTPSRPSSMYLEEDMDFPVTGSLSGSSVLHAGVSTPTVTSGTGAGVAATSTTAANSSASTSSSSYRYSIFGMPSWTHSAAPSISISTVQDPPTSPSSSSSRNSDGVEPAVGSSSRRSSIHQQKTFSSGPQEIGDSPQPASGVTVKAMQAPRDKGRVTNRKRSNSRNLGGFGLNTTHLGFQSVMPSERMAFKQLAGIVFRDADAARMTLRLLGRIVNCNNPKLATDYFNLLMLLMEVTPRNKELLCKNNGLRYMLQILFSQGLRHDGLGISTVGHPFVPKPTDPPYVDLVPAMGAYDISVEDVQMLFEAAYDPLEMFYRLTSTTAVARPSLFENIKDQLGSLPELPAQFEQDTSVNSKRLTGRARAESVGEFPSSSGRRASGHSAGFNQGSMLGPQVSPLFIREIEQQMMYAIEKISERVDPPAYFNFNGLNASLTTYPGTVEKIISAKGGYTVSMWAKVTAFLEKETGLFCYEEENGTRTIFELYFKSLDQSNRFCLCVRTQHYPSPPEDYVFDRFDFAETGIWHHIVLVHNKTMKLMVDGCTIQSYGTFNQRRQDKDSVMLGVFGRKGRHAMSSGVPNSPSFNEIASSTATHQSSPPSDSNSQRQSQYGPTASMSNLAATTTTSAQEPSLGYFCGQADRVLFLQGEWDQATAEKVYNLGPASTESWKALDIKNTVIAVLDPEDFKRDLEKAAETPKEVASPSTKSIRQELSDASDDRINLAHGILQGGCTIHKTQAMRNLIGEVGGIQLCFRFLETSPSHLQLVGLRVISNLLYKSPENLSQFLTELNGYDTMYELLVNTASELTVEHFGVLFDIAINGMTKDEHLILSNMPCVQLILRLLPSVADAVQGYILRTLVDLIVESSENMQLWRSSFGMTTLFDLLRSLPAHLRPFLMWTLESMVDGITVQELGLLIGFIGHEEPHLFDVRQDIIEMLYKRMTTDHYLVELLGSGLEGVTVLIGLLDSPNEHFRVLVLKMIGILLSDNIKAGNAALDKPNLGIELIRSTLEKYPLSMDVIQVLLGLAQNSYRCDPVFRLDPRKSAERGAQRASGVTLSGPPVPPKDSSVVALSSTMTIPMTGTGLQGSRLTQEDSQGGSGEPAIVTTQAQNHGNADSTANMSLVKPYSIATELTKVNGTPHKRTASPALSFTGGAGGAKITDELTYPSMMRLILELTGSLPHTDLVTHTLTDLKRLMTSENMRILWEAGWVNWIGAFIQDKTKVRVTSAAENLSYNRAMGVLDGIMQKMMIFDLSRKGSVTVRNKGKFVSQDEDVGVQLRLTEAALTWFDKNPNLDTNAAQLICKGLVILYRRVEELSQKFEAKQRQAEKAQLEAIERSRTLRAQLDAQEQERERLALEAVSSALSGVLNSLGDANNGEEFDAKSVLFKADEGDTDAEEVVVERADESLSSGSDGTEALMMGPGGGGAPLSGSTSPTGSSTSTLSLPLSAFSATMATSDANNSGRVYRHSSQHTRESFESSGHPRSPVSGTSGTVSKHGLMMDESQSHHPTATINQHQPHNPHSYYSHHHQLHHHHHHLQHSHHSRHQTSRRHQHLQSRSSSSTPPAVMDHNMMMVHHHHHHHYLHQPDLASGNGNFWPPLILYEHFATCINNLACYNNSAIRSAMKSSGLFKIRDSLLEKLGTLNDGSDLGSGSGSGSSSNVGPYPYHHPLWQQHQHQQQQQQQQQHSQSYQHNHQVPLHHPAPVAARPLGALGQSTQTSSASSTSPTYKETDIPDNNNNNSSNTLLQNPNLNNSKSTIASATGSPSSPAPSSSASRKDHAKTQNTHSLPSHASQGRKRQSQRSSQSGQSGQSGFGLGLAFSSTL
ncbi:hypothetical protein BGZ94_000845 [Podila epigama]|nr:hypothetical protein BGZ94_000845 [Podila epigama]